MHLALPAQMEVHRDVVVATLAHALQRAAPDDPGKSHPFGCSSAARNGSQWLAAAPTGDMTWELSAVTTHAAPQDGGYRTRARLAIASEIGRAHV